MVVPGGEAVPYERGTPVVDSDRCSARGTSFAPGNDGSSVAISDESSVA